MEPPAWSAPPAAAKRTAASAANGARNLWVWVGFKLILAALFAFVPVIFAFALDINMSLAGFPDGHVTDYEKAMVLPDHVLIAASGFAACYLVYRSLRAKNKRDLGMTGVSLICYIVLFFATRYGVTTYFVDFRHLDFGQGG